MAKQYLSMFKKKNYIEKLLLTTNMSTFNKCPLIFSESLYGAWAIYKSYFTNNIQSYELFLNKITVFYSFYHVRRHL